VTVTPPTVLVLFGLDLTLVLFVTYLSLRWLRVRPLSTWRWMFGAAAVALAGTVVVFAVPAARQTAVLWSVYLFVAFGPWSGFFVDIARRARARRAGQDH
jgi:hypothetical protein